MIIKNGKHLDLKKSFDVRGNALSDLTDGGQKRYLRAVYTAAMPSIDLKHNFTCDECGYDNRLEVPFTADFFWPDR